MAEYFELDLVGQPLESAALALAVLAYPGSGAAEIKARKRLFSSLCVWLVLQRCERDPDWANEPQLIRPAYLCLPFDLIAKAMRTLPTRIRDRLTAGHMAIPFLLEAERDVSILSRQRGRRLSINQMCEAVCEDLSIEAPENVESRVWRPSRPVLHICAAWAASVQERQRKHGQTPDVVDLYTNPEFLQLVMARAALYVPLLQKSWLKIKPEALIHVGALGMGS